MRGISLEILVPYTLCWKIEAIRWRRKIYPGLKSFVICSVQTIDWQLTILLLAQLFFMIFFDVLLLFLAAIRRFRDILMQFLIMIIVKILFRWSVQYYDDLSRYFVKVRRRLG